MFKKNNKKRYVTYGCETCTPNKTKKGPYYRVVVVARRWRRIETISLTDGKLAGKCTGTPSQNWASENRNLLIHLIKTSG